MAAYLIVDVEVTDPVGYEEYRRRVPATLEPYGGRFVVRGGPFEVLEGDWQPKRVVVLEFPSVERAKTWYSSAEYQQILPLRERNARSSMVLVEGV